MKGRLRFYAQTILWFDSEWLIRNELGRMAANFYQTPLVSYGQVRFGEKLAAEEVLHRVRGELLSEDLCDGVKALVSLLNAPLRPGQERQRASQVAAAYDGMVALICSLSGNLLERRAKSAGQSAAQAVSANRTGIIGGQSR